MHKIKLLLKQHRILIILLILGFFLRAADINNNPKALYGDELTIAYDSYSLLTTAHDSTGAFLPLTLKTGAGRPGGYVYGSIPFIAIFGPTAIGVRALSILSGVGIILLMFLLGKNLFNQKVGFLAAGLTVFSPWDISLSRGGFEAHLALFLALLGAVIVLSGSKKYWVITAIAFGLTLHTYPTYKLVLPAFLLTLFWFCQFKPQQFLNRKVMMALCVFLFLTILAAAQTFTGGSEERFLSLNVFSDHNTGEKITQSINYERNSDKAPAAISTLMHNRFIAFSTLLFNSYLENFSPDFLFISGDQNPVHNPATTGVLFYCQIILLFLGFAYLIHQNQSKKLVFLTLWLLIAPISATFLLETHGLRGAFMLPPLIILSSLGAFYLWQLSKQRKFQLISFVTVVMFVGQFLFFSEELYFISGQKFSNFWAYSAKLASEIAIKDRSRYDFVFISTSIDSLGSAFPVYARLDPRLVFPANKKNAQFEDFTFSQFGNVYLGNIPDTRVNSFLNNLPGSYLYIGPPNQSEQLKHFVKPEGPTGQQILVVSRSDQL